MARFYSPNSRHRRQSGRRPREQPPESLQVWWRVGIGSVLFVASATVLLQHFDSGAVDSLELYHSLSRVGVDAGADGGSAVTAPQEQGNSTAAAAVILHNDLMNSSGQRVGADEVWTHLLKEGAQLLKEDESTDKAGMRVLEVGMHTATQCLEAARMGLEAHCVEPSPRTFPRIKDRVSRQGAEIRDRIHLYNRAAGAESGHQLDFRAAGSTGDHVGEPFDIWTMTRFEEKVEKSEQQMVKVESLALDELIPDEGAFLLKVDTQGFEPTVFSGLQKSLRGKKIQFLMTEFWPKGIDFMHNKPEGTCMAADMLQTLLDAGYILYTMPTVTHPKGPLQKLEALEKDRPINNVMANCQWYYNLDKKQDPSHPYRMGYWSDILAVAPGARLSDTPATAVGRILSSK